MDTITAVIVTAFLNLAISTGIFLRVQKNIELSFSKQLEAFKTELQKDVIEHQVRFSASYPKTVETLENIHQQFVSLLQLLSKLPDRRVEKVDDEEFAAKENDVISAYENFSSYITFHRVYLPDETARRIIIIDGMTRVMCFIIRTSRNIDYVSPSDRGRLVVQGGNLAAGKIFQGRAEVLYAREAFVQLYKFEDELEQLYKSIAQAE
jgi:hypothetical protein